MARGPETRDVSRIRAAILARWPGAYIVKVHGNAYQESGIPDLLLTVHGRTVGLEVKHLYPSETPAAARTRTTLLQRSHLRRIVAAGGYAATVLGPDEAVRVIQRALGDGEVC